MKTQKHIAIVNILAAFTIALVVFTACEQPTSTNSSDITYTAAANDTTSTTAINFTFSGSVSGLTANDITVTNGTGSVTKGTLNGSGTSWSLAVTINTAGNVTVSINKSGIESGNKTVTVYKTGQTNITYTATRADGVDGATDTTGIVFTFSASVTGLTANDITVTSGTGSLTKGTLSGSGTSWTLGVTVTTAGNVTIAIAKTGIEAGTKDITVYKEGQTAPTLNSITAVYTQGSTIVYPTTSLDSLKAGLTVTAAYSNGVTLPVTSYALSGTLTVGASAVTVTYEGETTTFNVTVTAPTKTLTGITLNTTSVKRDYNQNETLDLTGLIVTANYSDSTSAAVSYTSTSPANGSPLSTAETITVTVNYTEGTITRSNTFTVTVIDITTPTEGLAYELIDNGTAYRVRKGWVTDGAVVIPATYEGLPVTEIGSVDDNWEVAAFSGTSITSITIPASVTSIGTSAFVSCASLATITFVEGSQLQTIGDSAFTYCTSLTSITIPASVTSIGNSAFYGWGNPPRMTLATVTFAPGSQLQTIGDEAFYYCANLTSITIPASVTSIGEYAFRECTSITEITIPAGVTSVGPGAFYNWGYPQTQTIYVEGYNSWAAADTAWGYWQGGGGAVIVVYGIVSEIEITRQPNKTEYLIGEQLDITGLEVTAHFSDNTTGTVDFFTAANITGFDSETAGTKTLTFTYGRKTATFTVTVVGLSSIAVTRQPNKTSYLIGEQLDITGLVVIAIYGNNAITETVTVTAADITGFNSATEGTKTLTVTINGKTATFTVTVFDPNNTIVITNTTEWNNAITTLNGQTGYYILNISGSFNVAGSANNTFGTTANGSTLTVRLIGNGTLSISGQGNMLRAGANQTIIIDSESLILKGAAGNKRPLIYVDGTSAKLELKNGTISGNAISIGDTFVGVVSYGGGVYVGASGTFIMSGGTISGNTAFAQTTQSATADARGGGVYVGASGTFIMTGGTISGNETIARGGGTTESYGGGVYNDGTFRIVNGTIYGDNASPSALRNTVSGNAVYNFYKSGAALYGTAQRGTFIGETWNSSGDLSTTDYTINVVNGELE